MVKDNLVAQVLGKVRTPVEGAVGPLINNTEEELNLKVIKVKATIINDTGHICNRQEMQRFPQQNLIAALHIIFNSIMVMEQLNIGKLGK